MYASWLSSYALVRSGWHEGVPEAHEVVRIKHGYV